MIELLTEREKKLEDGLLKLQNLAEDMGIVLALAVAILAYQHSYFGNHFDIAVGVLTFIGLYTFCNKVIGDLVNSTTS